MTNKDNKNLPAHPIQVDINPFERAVCYGLTKREYFAGLAMQGMAASQYWAENFNNNEDDLKNMAYVAVKAADALLKELETPTP